MNFETFELLVEQVPHLTIKEHAFLLYGLVRASRPLVIVETGTWQGYTACWLARGLEDNQQPSELYCIDNGQLPGADFSACHNHLQMLQLSHKVILVYGKSSDESLWPGRCDMAFIDGDHSANGCLTDFRLASTRGANIIVVHDTVSWWGPRLARASSESDDFHHIEFYNSEGLTIFKRKEPKRPESYSEEKYPDGVVHLVASPS